MNLAITAVAIFLLALPGVLFRRAFLRGPSSLPTAPRPLTDEIAYSVVFAAPLHLAMCWFLRLIGSQITPDLHATALLVLGRFGDKDGEMDGCVRAITEYTVPIFGYFFALFTASIVFGLTCHWLAGFLPVRIKRHLGLNDHWHQLFFSAKETFGYVTAIVEIGGKGFLYEGLLEGPDSLVFNRDGEIDRFVLSEAKRWTVSDDPREATTGGRIAGKYFILRYNEIKTLNVTLSSFRKVTDPGEIQKAQALADAQLAEAAKLLLAKTSSESSVPPSDASVAPENATKDHH